MKNSIFEVHAAAVNHLKTHGFKRKFSQADIRSFEGDDTERLWSLSGLFEIRVYSSPNPDITDGWARIMIDVLVGAHEKPNRAWYKYYGIHFDEGDTETVFSIQKGKQPKEMITGVKNLMQFRPEVGTYTLRLEKEGPAFIALQKRAGFLDLATDRQALIDGVIHMRGQGKVPFDFTKVPSEQLPWIIECCGRRPEFQNWDNRFESAKFWDDIVKNSNNLQNFKDFLGEG